MLTDMLSCICLLKHISKYLFIYRIWNQKKKTELNELNELECSKTPSMMSSYAHKHIFFYLHAQTNMNTLCIDPAQNHKKSNKIQLKFFVKKSLKIHNSKNICRRAFCLAPNERELSNLLILLILSKGAISRMGFSTFA